MAGIATTTTSPPRKVRSPDAAQGKKLPLKLKVAWKKGDFRSKQLSIDGPDVSKLLITNGPLVLVAASFCQTFLTKAKEQGIHVDSIEADASGECNSTAFYQKDHDRDAKDPWKSIQLKVAIEADASPKELQKLAKKVLKLYPAKELLHDHFPVQVDLNTPGLETDVKKISDYVNMDYYIAASKMRDSVIKRQHLTCVYDASDDDDVPLLHIIAGDISLSLSALETVPVGSTPESLPTPVHAFLYGLLAYFMETFVMRLGTTGYGIKSLEGTFKTVMNNGVKDYDDGLDPLVFAMEGGNLKLEVKSDAPREILNRAFLEAQSMAPSYLALSGSIDVQLASVEKLD